MNSRSGRILLSLVLVTAFQAFTLIAADKPAAVLHSSGTTTVNGSEAATTAAVFDGDNIQAITGIVTISAPGSTVLIPSNSELVLKENAVNLSSGAASINTTKGMGAQADAFMIAPATAGSARFDVRRSGNLVEIHATSGNLTINSASKTLGVAEGQTASLDTGTGQLSTGFVRASSSAPGTVASSNSQFVSLDRAIADDSSNVPYCKTAVCHHRPNVSGIEPCRCLKF